MTRTEQTIRQHFWWKTLREVVQKLCSTCDVSQQTNIFHAKYGHLPEKDAECKPWERRCVDMIGLYTIKRKVNQPLPCWCVTMIDPETSWCEIKQVQNREAHTLASVVEQTWLTRYPWPIIVVFDKSTEIMGEFARMVAKDYDIERKGITVRNPQANAIIEEFTKLLGALFALLTFKKVMTWTRIIHGQEFCQQRCLLTEQLSILLSKPHQRNWYLEEM
jgi:Integrase zinc binding domain